MIRDSLSEEPAERNSPTWERASCNRTAEGSGRKRALQVSPAQTDRKKGGGDSWRGAESEDFRSTDSELLMDVDSKGLQDLAHEK